MVAGTWIATSQDFTPVWDAPVIEATAYSSVDAAVRDELDETREVDYDELRETREPAPTVGAGVA